MADDRAYRVQVQYLADEEQYLALAPELAIEAKAANRAEALSALESEIEKAFEEAATAGDKIPGPIDVATEGGKLELDLAAPVWRDLVVHAAAQEMEPAELALQVLTRGLAHLDGRRRRPAKRDAAEAAPAAEEGEAAPEAKKDAGRRRNNQGGGNRGRGGRGGRREGYRPDMDDQANFLAYVRDQERGGRGRR